MFYQWQCECWGLTLVTGMSPNVPHFTHWSRGGEQKVQPAVYVQVFSIIVYVRYGNIGVCSNYCFPYLLQTKMECLYMRFGLSSPFLSVVYHGAGSTPTFVISDGPSIQTSTHQAFMVQTIYIHVVTLQCIQLFIYSVQSYEVNHKYCKISYSLHETYMNHSENEK